MKKEEYFCDICKSQVQDSRNLKKEIQVIFNCNQTDGYPCPRYLDEVRIDICNKCLTRRLKGDSIFAHGAQGHNDYYFQEGTT